MARRLEVEFPPVLVPLELLWGRGPVLLVGRRFTGTWVEPRVRVGLPCWRWDAVRGRSLALRCLAMPVVILLLGRNLSELRFLRCGGRLASSGPMVELGQGLGGPPGYRHV